MTSTQIDMGRNDRCRRPDTWVDRMRQQTPPKSLAQHVDPDRLSLRQVLMTNDRVTLDIVLLKENDKIRIWSSLFPDGTALVEDGVMTSMTGRETRWMTRCP